jgi:hypothetical protein
LENNQNKIETKYYIYKSRHGYLYITWLDLSLTIMGIRNLNKLLQTKCSTAITTVEFKDLATKRIAVDASIYMYRFLAEDALLENIYLMVSLFRHHDIHPVFVFDGKPPVEKTAVLEARKQSKQKAEKEYAVLESVIVNVKDEVEKQEIKQSMESLKKKFIRIREADTNNVKGLLRAYGVSYMDAVGEADVLCAKLALKNKVYACVSEDMDMFVYGCPRVIRYMSLLNQSAVMYDMRAILSCLELTMEEFRGVCVAAGTDYVSALPVALLDASGVSIDAGVRKEPRSLSASMAYMTRYKAELPSDSGIEFFEWLESVAKYDSVQLHAAYNMFVLNDIACPIDWKRVTIQNKNEIDKKGIVKIMTKEDFIFIDDEDEVEYVDVQVASPAIVAVAPANDDKKDEWHDLLIHHPKRGRPIPRKSVGHKFKTVANAGPSHHEVNITAAFNAVHTPHSPSACDASL